MQKQKKKKKSHYRSTDLEETLTHVAAVVKYAASYGGICVLKSRFEFYGFWLSLVEHRAGFVLSIVLVLPLYIYFSM